MGTVGVLSSLHDSRLVCLLSGLNGSGIEVSQSNFSEKFGKLVDLPGSLTLSAMLGELSAVAFEPSGISATTIKNAFMEMRTELVRFIAKSFVPGAGRIRDKLPTPAVFHSHCKLTGVYAATRPESPKNHAAAYEPYRKFYVTRQSDLAIKIQQLQSHIGDAISGLSPELAQLSKLNTGLGDILAVRTKELFTVVPQLLGRRFGRLLDEHWQELPNRPGVSDLAQWMESGGWISKFCGEMRELLLAEIDLRLQPVLGMIDSLSETNISDQTSDKGNNSNYG